jgi:hypothetical protein
MQAGNQRITGTVTRTRIAPGSKSDRVGVTLRTAKGDEYVLRRLGGNAFQDDSLEKLVGSTITATGLLADNTFIMKDWTIENRA